MKIEFYDDEDTGPKAGGFTHYRGNLPVYLKTKLSMLYQEVTLEEYLAIQFPPILLQRYPEQVTRDRETERAQISAAMEPGDSLWLWAKNGRAGVAVKRDHAVAQAWLVWKTSRTDDFFNRLKEGQSGQAL